MTTNAPVSSWIEGDNLMDIASLLAQIRAIKATLGEVPNDAQRRCIGCEPTAKAWVLVTNLEKQVSAEVYRQQRSNSDG